LAYAALLRGRSGGNGHHHHRADAGKRRETATGLVTFADSAGNALLTEASKKLTPATVEGVATSTVATGWKSPADEALFGLGQHQDGVINRKGSMLVMQQANTEIQIPVVVSNKGYGVLWDNPSKTTFAGNEAGNTQYSFSSEAGELVDYYYFYGPTIDRVIAGYRTATGAAPLFPKWAYGLFQSKDHYASLGRPARRRPRLSEQ